MRRLHLRPHAHCFMHLRIMKNNPTITQFKKNQKDETIAPSSVLHSQYLVSFFKAAQVIQPTLLFCYVTPNLVFIATTVQNIGYLYYCNINTPGRELSFLLLPLGFFAQSQSAASAGSSVAVPVSGSLAERNLSHVPGPQLAPENQHKCRVEKNRNIQ